MAKDAEKIKKEENSTLPCVIRPANPTTVFSTVPSPRKPLAGASDCEVEGENCIEPRNLEQASHPRVGTYKAKFPTSPPNSQKALV